MIESDCGFIRVLVRLECERTVVFGVSRSVGRMGTYRYVDIDDILLEAIAFEKEYLI